jgi:anaphase-promoting complex subunit 10
MATAVRSALAEKREIGDEAVWTLSSAKPGNGVEQLRDGNVDTFWQSDGPQPHLVNIQFHRKVRVKEIAIYTDFKLDESYTPARLSIRAGTGLHDLREVQQVTLQEPSGWVMIPLAPSGGGARGGKLGAAAKGVRAFLFQIAVLSSHQNGRDTHVRQVRIYGARPPETKGLNTRLPRFSSVEFNQVSTIR